MEQTFSKFELRNRINNKVLYLLMINNEESKDYFTSIQDEIQRRKSIEIGLDFEDLQWIKV